MKIVRESKKIRKFVRTITPKNTHMPLRIMYLRIINSYNFFRVQKPFTRVLGKKWTRTKKIIEIDITYACNMKCINCNRSCRQAPTVENMTLGQIKNFIKESIENKAKWKIIRLMGGEPTMNPNVLEIINLVLEYKHKHSPKTRIQVCTNGYGKFVEGKIKQIPEEVEVINSGKTTPSQYFYKFNIAPRDQLKYKYADYSNGCPVTEEIGIGLGPNGYYPCAVAAGIDRILGLDIGRKKFPQTNDQMRDQMKKLCQYCGLFGFGATDRTNREVMSPSWKKAYKEYLKDRSKFELTPYPEIKK